MRQPGIDAARLARRRARGEEQVECPRVEGGRGLDASPAAVNARRPTRGRPPSARAGRRARSRLARPRRPRRAPSRGTAPCSRQEVKAADRERRVCQDSEQWRVRQHESDLNGASVRGPELFDDARHAAEEAGAAVLIAGACGWPGWISRSKLSTTCRAVSGVPSWNRTPSRRRNVQTRPSLETDHESASAGSISLPASVQRTSVSKI